MVDHAASEAALRDSGVAFTALRNGFYAASALMLLGLVFSLMTFAWLAAYAAVVAKAGDAAAAAVVGAAPVVAAGAPLRLRERLVRVQPTQPNRAERVAKWPNRPRR